MKINAQIIKLATLFLFVVFMSSCSKDKGISNNCNCKSSITRVCVVYYQTGCSDPWDYDDESDEGQLNNLREFFKNKGIKLHNLGMDHDGREFMCSACHCSTGTRFCAQVSKKDLDDIKEYGFKEN